jgi:predicted transcriptional regulator
MKISEIVSAIDGTIICGSQYLDNNVENAFASDLMSDVLTLKFQNLLLVTGLSNIQSIRTAEMSDIQYVLIVRNKEVTADMANLAEESNMVLMQSPYSMFKVSGILYPQGLTPGY